MKFTQVMLTVPESELPEVFTFAARLISHDTAAALAEVDAAASQTATGPASSNGPDDLWRLCARAYHGGSGQFQKLLLEYLANNPGRPLTINEIGPAIDRDLHHFVRAMGAFSRRMEGEFPFRKTTKGGRKAYEMPEDAATIIRELAQQDPS